MSPRRREGHFLLLREGIYLPAPPLHLGTGHDLHKRYLSVSLRWWNTISSQRVPHRSAGVREGKQRTSLQECQKQDWLRSAGSTWSCGDLEESPIFQLRGIISHTRAVPSFVPAVYSLLGSFFISMTFEKHPHWWLPKVSCVTIVPPIVTAADEMSCSFLITTESDITGSDVIRELIQMIWNTRGEMWRGLKDKLDDNKKNNQLKFIKWTITTWHIQ